MNQVDIDHAMQLADEMGEAMCAAYAAAERCREQVAWVSFAELQNQHSQAEAKRQRLAEFLKNCV